MRSLSLCFVVSAALTCCGGKTEPTDLVFHIDAPMAGDPGCIGVVGFDVSISSGGRTLKSGPLLGAGPILDEASCHLSRPFSLQNADLNGPASVMVSGHDGAGIVRVEGMGSVPKLVDGAMHIQLRTSAPPPSPVLVLNRSNVLMNKVPLSAVTLLVITTMRRPEPLVTVTPGDYFSVEPAAYGVANLAAGGTDNNLALFADVTTTGAVTVPRAKLTAVWNKVGGYYEAMP